MGIVHNGRHLGVVRQQQLHASGNAHVGKPGHNLIAAHAQHLAHGDGRARVVHVEQARHAHGHVARPAGGVARKRDAALERAHVCGPHVRASLARGVRAAKRHHALAVAGMLKHRVELVGVKVHHRNARLVKNAQLAAKVICKVGVLHGANVIAPNIEEARDVQAQVNHAVVLERLARYLHHQVRQAGVRGVAHVAPQVGGFRCRVHALELLHAVERLDRAQDRRARLGAAGVQDLLQHVAHGRLALGARDAHHVDVAVRVAPRRGGGHGHGAAQVACNKLRHAGRHGGKLVRARVVAQVGDAAGLEGGRKVRRLERGPLAHEEVVRCCEARVAVRAGDAGLGRRVVHVGDAVKQALGAQKLSYARKSHGIHVGKYTAACARAARTPARVINSPRIRTAGAAASAGALQAQDRGFESLAVHHRTLGRARTRGSGLLLRGSRALCGRRPAGATPASPTT